MHYFVIYSCETHRARIIIVESKIITSNNRAVNTIIRNSTLNETDNTSKRGRQLKAMIPANRYYKAGVSEAERSVRFINVGNLEILGDGVLFFFPEERGDTLGCIHIETSRVMELAEGTIS